MDTIKIYDKKIHILQDLETKLNQDELKKVYELIEIQKKLDYVAINIKIRINSCITDPDEIEVI